jgi:hypothetical protein
MEEMIDIVAELGDIFVTDLVLTARAEAVRAIEANQGPARGGNARAVKIVTRASLVLRLSQLLAGMPERTTPRDLRILRIGVDDLKALVAA